jgi:glutamate racemase
VAEIAAPALVPLVEAGLTDTSEARAAVREICAQFPADLEAIVYGCTHYPLLDAHFAALLGASVARIDPADFQAAAAAAFIRAAALMPGTARTRYLTNADVAAFERNIRAWTGDADGPVTAVEMTTARAPAE